MSRIINKTSIAIYIREEEGEGGRKVGNGEGRTGREELDKRDTHNEEEKEEEDG